MTSGEELLELRKSTGMNRREFAEYFEIPYRTVQDWELGNRRKNAILSSSSYGLQSRQRKSCKAGLIQVIIF